MEQFIKHYETLMEQYKLDLPGIEKLSQFLLMESKALTVIRHDDSDGLVCSYLSRPFSNKDIEYTYSPVKNILDVITDEILLGENRRILVMDVSIKPSENKRLVDIMEYAKTTGHEIFWVDHHKSTKDALLEFGDSEMPFYVTEYKMASCLQMYLGIIHLCMVLLKVTENINNTNKDSRCICIDFEKELKKFKLVESISRYDTMSNLDQIALLNNDILTATKREFEPEEFLENVYKFYDVVVNRGSDIGNFTEIYDELKWIENVRNSLLNYVESKTPAAKYDNDGNIIHYLVYLDKLNHVQSRVASVVANVYINKHQHEFKRPLLVVWHYEATDSHAISFRSLDDTALKTAKLYGGGGHNEAAGCEYREDIVADIIDRVAVISG